jgi:hypothetical protein
MNVVEHREEDMEGSSSDEGFGSVVAFQIESSDGQKALMDISKARKKLHKRAKQLQRMQQMMQHQEHSSSPDGSQHHH